MRPYALPCAHLCTRMHFPVHTYALPCAHTYALPCAHTCAHTYALPCAHTYALPCTNLWPIPIPKMADTSSSDTDTVFPFCWDNWFIFKYSDYFSCIFISMYTVLYIFILGRKQMRKVAGVSWNSLAQLRRVRIHLKIDGRRKRIRIHPERINVWDRITIFPI